MDIDFIMCHTCLAIGGGPGKFSLGGHETKEKILEGGICKIYMKL